MARPQAQSAPLQISEDTDEPPDGGYRAWAVLAAAFVCNGVTFAPLNSYGVIYKDLDARLKKEGATHSESEAALAGALALGLTYMLSILSGVVSALIGLKATSAVGGAIIVFSLFISSFVTHSVSALCFTYGFLYGLGASLAYTPAIAILGHYFKKRLGIANGIVTLGESFFTVLWPFLMEYMINNYGLKEMFRVLAVLAFSIVVGSLLYKPRPSMVFYAAKGDVKLVFQSSLNCDIWNNLSYRMWCISMSFGVIGQYIPYMHLGKFTKVTFPNLTSYYENIPLQCLAASSMVARLVFGYIADVPRVDVILVQQISFFVLGTLTMIVPFLPSFTGVVLIALGMGIVEGAFMVVTGPIATELLGVAFAPHGIGYMLGLSSVPLSFGPPFAGYLYGVTGSYVVPFIFAGLWLITAASLMFTVRYPCFAWCGRGQTKVSTG